MYEFDVIFCIISSDCLASLEILNTQQLLYVIEIE